MDNGNKSTSAEKVTTPRRVEDSICTTPVYNTPSYSASPQPMMTYMLTVLTALLDKQEESRRREREEAEKIRKEEAERMRIREERSERERKEVVERLEKQRKEDAERLEKQRKEEVASQKKKDDELLELRRQELEYVKKRDTEEAEKKLKREQVLEQEQVLIEKTQRAEQVLATFPKVKSGDQLDVALENLEDILAQSGISQDRWMLHLKTVLTGKHAELLNSLYLPPETTFEAAKQLLLQAGDYTVAKAGSQLFDTNRRELRDKTALDYFLHFNRLGKRIFKGVMTVEEALHALTLAAVRHYLCADAKRYLDSRKIFSNADLMAVLRSYRDTTGCFPVEEVHTYQRRQQGYVKPSIVTCFSCKEQGHRAVDCPRSQRLPMDRKKSVTCYSCGKQGHYSSECSKQSTPIEEQKEGHKDAKKKEKPAKRVEVADISLKEREADDGSEQNVLNGRVGDHFLPFVLDSGAHITVVPAEVVDEELISNETILIRDANGGLQKRRTAEVLLTIGSQHMTQKVAVAPGESLGGKGLLALDFGRDEDFELVKRCREEAKRVRAVQTRGQTANEEREEKMREEENMLGEFVPKDPDLYGGIAQKENSEQVQQAQVEDPIVAVGGDEDSVVEASGIAEESSEVEGRAGEKFLDLSCVKEGSSVEEIRKLTREDETLEIWKALADKGEKGFSWNEGLLVKRVLDCMFKLVNLIILPTQYRTKVLHLAHEKSGHFARRKTLQLIRRSFLWPLLAKDVSDHCKSCQQCQRMGKSTPRKAPMIEREIVSVPFETVAIDLVGPFEKGRRGYRYLLTYVCMASKWPEAIPIKSIKARSVLDGVVEIFTRNGIPLTMLSDQGAQLTGTLMKELCYTFGIAKIKTTPYRPQSNGVVERMHGTLVPMLRKTMANKLDWVKQVPLALYAMRLAPHTDTGVSPFEFIHGTPMHSPLDILHDGWLDKGKRKLNVLAWVEELADRLELLKDAAHNKHAVQAVQRKDIYDRGSTLRKFEKGDRVLLRTPGLVGKLEESWTGPWEVVHKCGIVNYKVREVGNRGKGRVVLINTMKEYDERVERMRRMMVVVEDEDGDLESVGDGRNIVGEGGCEGFNKQQLQQVLDDFRDTLSSSPGLTSLTEMTIDTEEGPPVVEHPYRPPESMLAGIKTELESLLDQGIITRLIVHGPHL